MAIEMIDTEKCTGCETCFTGCPCDVIRMDAETGKAAIAYKEDCQNCHICKYFCPVQAITTSTSVCTKPVTGWG